MHRTQEVIVTDVREAFRLVKKGIFNVEPLINRRYGLSQIADAFKKEMEDQSSVKTVITP